MGQPHRRIGNALMDVRDGGDEDEIPNPVAHHSQFRDKKIKNIPRSFYQSIRCNFSLIVPGGVLRFMNSPTIAITTAVIGRFM